jgi:ABC-type enterochelin transport system permease subunit
MDEEQDYFKIKKIYVGVLFGIAIGAVMLIFSLYFHWLMDNPTLRYASYVTYLSYQYMSVSLFVIGAIIIVASITYGIKKILRLD